MTDIITDHGIIIGLLPHGETSAIVTLFSENHGKIKAYAKGAKTKQHSGTFQKGNLVEFEHVKNLTEQLGYIKADPIMCLWVGLMDHRFSFLALNMLCDLFYEVLQDYVTEQALYHQFKQLLDDLSGEDIIICGQKLSHFLLYFLAETGFAPDLSKCIVTGTSQNLCYVSPKSACAVSKNAGEDYKNKLLPLPDFLSHDQCDVHHNDIQNALKLLGFFIEKHLFLIRDKFIPQSYHQLYRYVQTLTAKA